MEIYSTLIAALRELARPSPLTSAGRLEGEEKKGLKGKREKKGEKIAAALPEGARGSDFYAASLVSSKGKRK